MDLTISDIQCHIAEYKGRVEVAKLSLANLPKGRLPYPEHKKRQKQRQEYKADIKHYFQLIEYANEGIELRLKEAG